MDAGEPQSFSVRCSRLCRQLTGKSKQHVGVIIIFYQVNMEITLMTTNVEHDLANYQSQLWQMADTLRGSMDASEYKHVVLGLIFLKYISDAFEETHAQLELEREEGADPEDPGRVPSSEYILGSARGTLDKPSE